MRKLIGALEFLAVCGLLATANIAGADPKQPNILVILCDDVGFSDVGSYGGEIPTPNLDKLAKGGVRFTQFYNMARCCPSRASLMTGLYPHQAGIGHMLKGNRFPGYTNQLSTDSVTMAEVLKQAGYKTYMTGKWHLGRMQPLDRGFDKFYGILGGAANYYDPKLTRDRHGITVKNDPEYKPEKYYFTDAISDNSIRYLEEHNKQNADKPFFMYVAYTAAHWPIQAPEDEIALHKGKYDAGYDVIRKARFEKMKELGIVDKALKWSETVGNWDKVQDKAWEARFMEVYAAMITRMDKGIGRIIETLRAEGKLDNTIVMFMQDNGGCAEPMWRDRMIAPRKDELKPVGPNENRASAPPSQTRDGRPVRTGPGVMAGPEDTYLTYGENWANVSNTPFRKYKHWTNEGGISTPLIVHWPEGISEKVKSQFVREPSHLIDIMATAIDAADTSYPAQFHGNSIAPLAGKSLLPLLQDGQFDRGEPIFWEHESNRAVRDGKWKLVTEGTGPWELYDISIDRAELNNLADRHPDLVKRMSDQWQAWAKRNDVLPLGTWKTAGKSDAKPENNAKPRAKKQGKRAKQGN